MTTQPTSGDIDPVLQDLVWAVNRQPPPSDQVNFEVGVLLRADGEWVRGRMIPAWLWFDLQLKDRAQGNVLLVALETARGDAAPEADEPPRFVHLVRLLTSAEKKNGAKEGQMRFCLDHVTAWSLNFE